MKKNNQNLRLTLLGFRSILSLILFVMIVLFCNLPLIFGSTLVHDSAIKNQKKLTSLLSLKNGIPVIYRKIDNSDILYLNVSFAFGQKVIPVDTHCHRIPNRLSWVKTKIAEKTEIELNKIIPEEYRGDFNAIFVQFGRDICQPVSPKCSICPLNKFCPKIGVVKSR